MVCKRALEVKDEGLSSRSSILAHSARALHAKRGFIEKA